MVDTYTCTTKVENGTDPGLRQATGSGYISGASLNGTEVSQKPSSKQTQAIFSTCSSNSDKSGELSSNDALRSKPIRAKVMSAPVQAKSDTEIPSSRQVQHQKSQGRRNSTDLLLLAATQTVSTSSGIPVTSGGSSIDHPGKSTVKKTAATKKGSPSRFTKAVSSSNSSEKSTKKAKRERQPRAQLGQPRPHVYHDYSAVLEIPGFVRKKTGGVSTPFPEKLMEMLAKESDENPSIISWLPHGRAFIIRKPREFAERIMATYFNQSKLTSFQRQLNLYGFRRLTQGPDAGAYYHEMFLRGRVQLAARMIRQKVKGVGHKQPSHAESEPNLYSFISMPDGPGLSSTDESNAQSNDIQVTPASTKQYCTLSSSTANPQLVPSSVGSGLALVSPSIHAAHLLKSMATARITPGSFVPTPTCEVNCKSSALPPPPPLASARRPAESTQRSSPPKELTGKEAGDTTAILTKARDSEEEQKAGQAVSTGLIDSGNESSTGVGKKSRCRPLSGKADAPVQAQ